MSNPCVGLLVKKVGINTNDKSKPYLFQILEKQESAQKSAAKEGKLIRNQNLGPNDQKRQASTSKSPREQGKTRENGRTDRLEQKFKY
jgi:hypothetical protein